MNSPWLYLSKCAAIKWTCYYPSPLFSSHLRLLLWQICSLMRFGFQSVCQQTTSSSQPQPFSPGKCTRSLSDFPVMELQDKLDLMIHLCGAPLGGLSLPPSPTRFGPKPHYLRPIFQLGLSRENKGGGGANEHRK